MNALGTDDSLHPSARQVKRVVARFLINHMLVDSAMAAEEATDNAASSNSERGGNSLEDESHSESDEEPTEMLVAGREKRVTAGNRMSSLLEREGDEDLDLLFAEDEEEEDDEFQEDDAHASDAELDSSSDDEDQGPTQGDGEFTGEQELMQQEKAERKKRKAREVFKKPAALRKRVKMDETTVASPGGTGEPQSRPKKKWERFSWVHNAVDAPTRTSSRKQTVEQREVAHKRLLDNERQRAKVMRQMEEAQKRKDSKKAKPMTQAERLEEAAKTERKNAKSLNRWEEAEKKRAEVQRTKLEALHNRQLTGPVISWWSVISRWLNGKIAEVGIRDIRKAGHREESGVLGESRPLEEAPRVPSSGKTLESPERLGAAKTESNQQSSTTKLAIERNHPATQDKSFKGIHAYAALPTPYSQPEFTGTAHGDGTTPIFRDQAHSAHVPTLPPSVIPPRSDPPLSEYLSRNLVALKSIDANAARLPELQNGVLLLKKKAGKPPKPPAEICAITSQPAKFRDPRTGLPYANAYAYSQIRRLQDGGARWSNLLECYAGSSHAVARGVPERFWKRS